MTPKLELFRFKKIMFKIVFFFHLLKIIMNECERDTPIRLSNDTCVLKYCSKEEYNSGECTINNTIIKTQFPNKIIIIGEEKFRYINFVTLSNGDMIIETSPFPANNKRIFYGLKNNGRYYFYNRNRKEETPFKYLIADEMEEYKYESGNSIIINNGKEYIVNIGRLSSYTELFDFDNNKIISE